MCPAVPYALGSKLAFPERPVIACIGDGAMQMLGLNGLIDLMAYADRWSTHDPRLVVLVLNNRDLNQVTWEQRVLAGDAKLEASQVLPPFDYAAFAAQSGAAGSSRQSIKASSRRCSPADASLRPAPAGDGRV